LKTILKSIFPAQIYADKTAKVSPSYESTMDQSLQTLIGLGNDFTVVINLRRKRAARCGIVPASILFS
jgi:hypothetical protein